MSTTQIINPDAVHGVHTCDTAVLGGLTRAQAEALCGACQPAALVVQAVA